MKSLRVHGNPTTEEREYLTTTFPDIVFEYVNETEEHTIETLLQSVQEEVQEDPSVKRLVFVPSFTYKVIYGPNKKKHVYDYVESLTQQDPAVVKVHKLFYQRCHSSERLRNIITYLARLLMLMEDRQTVKIIHPKETELSIRGLESIEHFHHEELEHYVQDYFQLLSEEPVPLETIYTSGFNQSIETYDLKGFMSL